jgi:hypothetical protein
MYTEVAAATTNMLKTLSTPAAQNRTRTIDNNQVQALLLYELAHVGISLPTVRAYFQTASSVFVPSAVID